LSGPFEHHITACVSIAAWNYYCVTQDKNWLRERGWPILSATADFWSSRVERNGPGKYEIKNVVAAMNGRRMSIIMLLPMQQQSQIFKMLRKLQRS
jgi:hypothetical protein